VQAPLSVTGKGHHGDGIDCDCWAERKGKKITVTAEVVHETSAYHGLRGIAEETEHSASVGGTAWALAVHPGYTKGNWYACAGGATDGDKAQNIGWEYPPKKAP
jgi:hypothetical protein